MTEIPHLPSDPESLNSGFLPKLGMQVRWADRGKQVLESNETSQLLITEATPPNATSPDPKLLGMLLEREDLINQIAARETDPISPRDQLSALQQSIYDEKVLTGIPVVEPQNLPLDNGN